MALTMSFRNYDGSSSQSSYCPSAKTSGGCFSLACTLYRKILTGYIGSPPNRMSSNNGQNSRRDSSSQSGGQSDSRKSSSLNLVSSSSRSHDGGGRSSHVQASHDLIVGLALAEPVDFAKLQHAGLDFLDDPAGGQKWLVEFGYLKNDTNVSLLLRGQDDHGNSESPYSLFPLLALWVASWYKIAQEKRKAEKATRILSQHEFDWLLAYIADYVDLGHDAFRVDEMHQICSAVLNVCQLTTRASDIDVSITIIHRVTLHNAFPKDLLGLALDVFCASTTILPEPPIILFNCIQLFLLGSMQDEALDQLFDFVITPTIQNNSQHLNQGRGALRQLSACVDLRGASDDLIISTSRLVNGLHQASKSCIYRYCTEVLRAFHIILESPRVDEIFSSEYTHIMDTIDNCIRTVLPRSTSSRGPLPLQSPDREEVAEQERHTHRYLSERNEIVKKLLADFESCWSILSLQQRTRVGDLLMDHARDLTDSQASLVIKDLPPLTLSRSDIGEWSARIAKVFDAFVRNQKLSGHSRLEAMRYCATTARSIIVQGGESFAETKYLSSTAGNNLVDRLLNVLNNEYDTEVVYGLLTLVKDLAFVSNQDGHLPYADLVVRRLLWFVKNEREGSNETDDEHVVLYTHVILDIFIHSLDAGGIIASKVFEALVEIAESAKSRMCQLAALRLLVRIRCDNKGKIFLEKGSDSLYIAAALCRTEESQEGFVIDSSGPRLSISSANAAYFGAPKQLWSYPQELTYTKSWKSSISSCVAVKGTAKKIESIQAELRMSDWLYAIMKLFQGDTDWEVLSFMLVHIGAQLFNTRLFNTSLESIVKLRQILCDQVVNGTFRDPPMSTGLKKSDTALCMFNLLTALIPYARQKSEHIQKGFGDDLVKAFLSGIGGAWDGTSRGCIHALCVCSFEVPASVASQYPNIITKISKNITQSHLTIHILEFLAQVARLPDVHSNFTQDEITMILGICLQCLEKTRDQHNPSVGGPFPRSSTPARQSGINLKRTPYRAAMLQDLGPAQYASALAYQTILFWFLSLKLEFRAKYVSWIVPRLVWKNATGDESIEEQSQVLIDFMQRTAFSDLGETKVNLDFAENADGEVLACSWIVGLSIVTAEMVGRSGRTLITKRQASGTTHAIYQQLTAALPSHHVPVDTEIRTDESSYATTLMLPPHILLQMVSTAAPTSVEDQPLPLPTEEFVTRALNVFDRVPTVDSHKLGVLYIGQGQENDIDYLANRTSSMDYQHFLSGLGYEVSLEEPVQFNPQGLQYPRDGQTTLAWRDRITEIVYHIPTMMPNNLTEDPTCTIKKSHVGNCHVIIVFNDSGLPWKMENFPSAVTFVHIVITPANCIDPLDSIDMGPEQPQETAYNQVCDFFSVHVLTKENYPNVTPAADPKVISRDMLPGFVRMLGTSASVFSHAKIADDNDDHEFPSTWRTRLQHIKRLKQRVLEKSGGHHHHTGTPTPHAAISSVGGRRTPVTKDDGHGIDRDSGRDGTLAVQLDFGKWTL